MFVVLGWFAWVTDLVGLPYCVLRFGLVVLVWLIVWLLLVAVDTCDFKVNFTLRGGFVFGVGCGYVDICGFVVVGLGLCCLGWCGYLLVCGDCVLS